MIMQKIILLSSLMAVMVNASSAEEKSIPLKKSWAKITKSSPKKEDCIDCYATPIVTPKKAKPKVKYYGVYDYVEAKTPVKMKNIHILPVVDSTNNSYGRYAKHSNITIQVGAFRKYSGARRYKRRYNALSNHYAVSIKTVYKNKKPLYRVQIEGFKNRSVANAFIDRYALNSAFLVRK